MTVNNPFEWEKNYQIKNKKTDLLKIIENLIVKEELEEARSVLDEYIPDNQDPLKRSIIQRMNKIINDSDSEGQEQRDYFNSYMFDGSDPDIYYNLDEKLVNGTITFEERRDLYAFWSAYPQHKTNEYCLEMFKWIMENNGACCSDLLKHMMDLIIDKKIACFYFFISRDRGYLEGVSHLIERYLEYFNPAIQHAANLEYRNYLEKKEISPAYILNEATVAR